MQKTKISPKQRWESILETLKAKGNAKLWSALLLLFFFLLVVALFSSQKNTATVPVSPSSAPFDASQYAKQLEASLKDLIEHIDGAGKTTVFVTVENGIEYVYATQGTEESSQTTLRKTYSYVFAGGYSASQPILIKELQPTVRGVVVLCRGGDNAAVKLKVTEAVKTALRISANRVYVTTSK